MGVEARGELRAVIARQQRAIVVFLGLSRGQGGLSGDAGTVDRHDRVRLGSEVLEDGDGAAQLRTSVAGGGDGDVSWSDAEDHALYAGGDAPVAHW